MAPTGHRGPLPTYLRIAETLTIEIGCGRLAAGTRLPTERAMAAAEGVSVATLRKALGLLVARGLVEKRQGSGNYVLAGAANVGTYALFRLQMVNGGGYPTAEVLDFARLPKPADLLDIGPIATGYRIRRLRLLNALPVAVEEVWLDARFATLRREDLSESLYRTYADKLHLQIGHAEDRVHTGPLPDWAPAARIGADPGATMGLVERRGFDQYGEPAEMSRSWFNPARARYFARVS